jgi:hypothetical protein
MKAAYCRVETFDASRTNWANAADGGYILRTAHVMQRRIDLSQTAI